MDRKLKIGVLGGGRGVALAEGARANGMEVAAVCDRDELCAKWAAKRLECKSFTDYEQMLDTDIDAVVVANYAVAHVWAVKQALAAGKHVMSECMACFTMAEAVELVEAVEAAHGLVYFFAENYPFMVQNLEMRRLYATGELGEFRYGEGEYVHPMTRNEIFQLTSSEDHWRNWLPATYYCTHSMGPVMLVTGTRPEYVTAMVVPRCDDDPGMTDSLRVNDDVAVILCKMNNGAVTKILPWSGLRDHGVRYRICCSKGTMEWNQGNSDLRVRRWEGDFQETVPDKPFSMSYQPNLPPEHLEAQRHGHGGGDYFTSHWFRRAILTGEKPLIDVYQAVDMTMIGIQGYRSALSHANSFEIPDLHDAAMRDKYRHDDWNPDPARPCADKPFPSVTGRIEPTAQAHEAWRHVRTECEAEIRRQMSK